MNKKLLIRFSAFLLLFLITVSSVGLPIISHQCNFSKKKSIHFFAFEHKCKKEKCQLAEVKNSEKQISKIPCCSLESSFVKNTDHTGANTELSIKQAIILKALFSVVLGLDKQEQTPHYQNVIDYHLYGYRYRIAMQSFLC